VHDIPHGERTCLYVDAWGTRATSDIRVYGNTLHHCAAGITLASEDGGLVRDIHIYNNVIYASQSNGLEIGDWGEFGVLRHPVETVTFVNNTVYANGTGGWGAGFWNGNSHVKHIVVRNTVFSQNETAQMLNESTASLTVDHNLIDGTQDDAHAIAGTEAVEGDPLFVDPVQADFRLRAGSPAIDAGSAVDAPETDLSGQPRPRDGDGDGAARFDIGAYEAGPEISYTNSTYLALVLNRG
jgi:hypothetical protein